VYAVSAVPLELASPVEPLRVLVIEDAPRGPLAWAVEELRREAIHAEVGALTSLDVPPTAPVCVVRLDAATCALLVPRFVAWAAQGAVRTGLIAVVENASAEVTEAVLAEGFDDVVRAPIGTRELVARVRAVHRRVFWKGTSNGRLRFADLTLDLYGRELWVAGTTVVLTSVELAVLRELMKARGRPLSRAELLDLAWGEGELDQGEKTIQVHVSHLRDKPEGDPAHPAFVPTIRGGGVGLRGRREASGGGAPQDLSGAGRRGCAGVWAPRPLRRGAAKPGHVPAVGRQRGRPPRAHRRPRAPLAQPREAPCGPREPGEPRGPLAGALQPALLARPPRYRPASVSPVDLQSKIRDIPDFPKRGIVFKDIMPLLADPEALHETVERLAEFGQPRKPDVVPGAEALRFIPGAAHRGPDSVSGRLERDRGGLCDYPGHFQGREEAASVRQRRKRRGRAAHSG